MNTASKNVFTRFLSAMLAVIMIFGLLPGNLIQVTAEAAMYTGEPDDTCEINYSGSQGTYYSEQVGSRCQFHTFQATGTKMKTIDAFCGDHSGKMGAA